MDDLRVVTVARALVERGVAALRFDFRSEFGQGIAERDDARRSSNILGKRAADDAAGALDFLADQPTVAPGRLALAGYSFGAGVAMHCAAQDPRTRALALIAPPDWARDAGVLAGYRHPVCIVVGDRDPVSPADEVRAFAARLTTPVTVHVLPGVDHFFGLGLDRMSALVGDFFADQLHARNRHK